MKKRIWIPVAVVLIAVCAWIFVEGALPEQKADMPDHPISQPDDPKPEQNDPEPEPGMLAHLPEDQRLDAVLERIRGLQTAEIETALVHVRFLDCDPAELTTRIQSTVDHRIEREGNVDSIWWQLSVSMPALPKKSEKQEGIKIFASPTEENILEVEYRSKDRVQITFLVEDSELYWFIRNAYSTVDVIDEEAMAPYRALLEAEAQDGLDRSVSWPQPASGYEILSFQHVDSFQQDGADYIIYHWDVAFLSEDPLMAGWAGGMWLDNQCRIRDYVRANELCVRTVNGETDYGLWGIYDFGVPVNEAQRESGRRNVVSLFAEMDKEVAAGSGA